MKHSENQVIKGEKYAVVNTIYPPKYSVIRLIGDTGYAHVQSFRRKKLALDVINHNGGVLSVYNDTPVVERIIPYTEEALRWHLYNNANLSGQAIEGIVADCNAVNRGGKLLTDLLPGTTISIGEMLDDLKIDYNSELALM